MMIRVTAVRDDNKESLGNMAFDIADQESRSRAMTEFMNTIWALFPDALNPPPFTLHFDKA